MGGMGNQFFQIAFAKFLQTIGYKVFINIDFFNSKTKKANSTIRHLVLDPQFFNLPYSSKVRVLFIKFLNKFIKSNKIPKIFKNVFFSKNFLKIKNLEDFNKLKSLPSVLHCEGYWQDISIVKYFRVEFETFLKEKIIELNKQEKKVLKGSTLLHIRRTDYIDINEELNESYYLDAIELLSNNDESFNFDIFSDDTSLQINEQITKKSNKIFLPLNQTNHLPNKIIETFIDMLFYENYILSNSTYSLLASEFSYSTDKIIISPKPWFRNRPFYDIYPKNALFVKNEI